MTVIRPPKHVAWSIDRLDLADEFQHKWYIHQVLEHGLAEDIAGLDLDDVAQLLPELNLPPHLHSLWARFLESRHKELAVQLLARVTSSDPGAGE